eukprot:symbB.v1.2.027815.t1/scaffold2876.1/size118008/3
MFNPLPGIPVPGQSCSQNPEACGYFGRTERVALVFLAICLTAKLPMIFLDCSASNQMKSGWMYQHHILLRDVVMEHDGITCMRAPSKPVTGPLMLDADKDSGSMFDQFKQKVSEDTKDVESTAGNWIDEVSKSLKSGIKSAADAVEGKADKTADKADDVAKEVKQKIKDIKDKNEKDAPETLLAQEKGTSPVVLLLLPCIGLGVAAGVYLRRRADDDELAPVYHMQV